MTKITKEFFILFISIYILATFAYSERYLPEGQKITSIDLSLHFDSELNLPTEGDSINFMFSMSPYNGDIQTNESFYVDYAFIKPDGQFGPVGFASFPEGPYVKGKTYHANTKKELGTPGIWKVYYTVTNNEDFKNIGDALFNSSNPQDYQNRVALRSKEIHVLSFYEASSIRSSNNSVNVSIIGVIGTFLAFLLGMFGNFIIDRFNYSPKIKVSCAHAFIKDGSKIIPAFSIEAINYGRVSVTLDGVGIRMKEPKENLWIIKGTITPLQFPFELLPGKNHTVLQVYQDLKKDIEGKIPDKAYFKDETGRIYYSGSVKKMFKE